MTGQPFEMLVPYFERRLTDLDFINLSDKDRPKPSREEGSINIRFDWEFAPENLGTGPWKNVNDVPLEVQIPCFIPILAYDLADICVNGDVDSNDPVLKAMDGEHKLGERFKDFYISPALYRTEYKWRKDVVEWEIYITIKGIRQ